MSKSAGMTIDRRELLRLLGIGSAAFTAASLAGPPVHAQTRKDTLILAVDFSDTVTLDPAHESNYTSGRKFRLTWAIPESAKLRFPASRRNWQGVGKWARRSRSHVWTDRRANCESLP
jgi:hypothetical protein